jgi:hypothetical protein
MRTKTLTPFIDKLIATYLVRFFLLIVEDKCITVFVTAIGTCQKIIYSATVIM